jgi:hypothetical protein
MPARPQARIDRTRNRRSQKKNIPTLAQVDKMRKIWTELREGLGDLDAGIRRFRSALDGVPFSPPKK